eukprot:365441-Chlamydomonas_euryale.AAC.6
MRAPELCAPTRSLCPSALEPAVARPHGRSNGLQAGHISLLSPPATAPPADHCPLRASAGDSPGEPRTDSDEPRAEDAAVVSRRCQAAPG